MSTSRHVVGENEVTVITAHVRATGPHSIVGTGTFMDDVLFSDGTRFKTLVAGGVMSAYVGLNEDHEFFVATVADKGFLLAVREGDGELVTADRAFFDEMIAAGHGNVFRYACAAFICVMLVLLAPLALVFLYALFNEMRTIGRLKAVAHALDVIRDKNGLLPEASASASTSKPRKAPVANPLLHAFRFNP